METSVPRKFLESSSQDRENLALQAPLEKVMLEVVGIPLMGAECQLHQGMSQVTARAFKDSISKKQFGKFIPEDAQS